MPRSNLNIETEKSEQTFAQISLSQYEDFFTMCTVKPLKDRNTKLDSVEHGLLFCFGLSKNYVAHKVEESSY